MSEHDDLPIYRPKVGGRTRKEKAPVLGTNARKAISPARGGYVKRGHRPAHVKPAGQFYRKVIVKARVVKMNAYGRKAALLHEKYLQREHVGKDGSEGRFYDPKEDSLELQAKPTFQGEQHQFRFIISPADAHELELTEFTKELMQQMEQDIGREVYWKAVNHYNTDNPHVHVIVRGVGKDGRELRIDPDYISNGLRYRAQEQVTRELGLQPQWEAEQALTKEIGKSRFTSLDARLSKLEQNGTIDIGHYPDKNNQRIMQGRLESRMQTLERYGLAEKSSARHWRMQDGWQDALKEMGRRHEIYLEMHKQLDGDASRYRMYDKAQQHEPVEGKLVGKGLSDELGDRYFFIVETRAGSAFYVPLEKGMDPEKYRKGDIISIRSEKETWLKTSDRIIADQASKNGGRYDRNRHVKEIKDQMVAVGNGRVGKEDFVAAIEKRLQRLQRFNLTSLIQDGTWQVDPALVEKLQRWDQEKPVSRMEVQRETDLSLHDQVSYRGRTWLDRFTAEPEQSGMARYGFGKELNSSVQRRIVILRELGVDPMDPARAKALDQVEKRDLAQNIAKQTGSRYKEISQGGKVAGVMTNTGRLPSGKQYAQVHDLKSREFSMVPWRKDYERLTNKTVELARTSTGRFFMRKIERGIGR
ncbi:MAG: relaxase/mobilization nuclease and DUF3363 domain-containing protein [Chlorobium phaeobacteroides]|uniref:Uncharacterized protein n=1 Tax=Chlorobium phaeobacteroides (strain BS1) TaxID=331678 RepID=B3ENB3_CHLPB|nr:relaxase/mobilization nuclease and DUF3363 domain-containing protein [Chlorobium phaeobacteroides]MBL6956677.1 relaxase/mobilization nuclease and DUF3363 domain-containing protein [Chlorobium phaeobacteroides]